MISDFSGAFFLLVLLVLLDLVVFQMDGIGEADSRAQLSPSHDVKFIIVL